jgi:hypothetical protein
MRGQRQRHRPGQLGQLPVEQHRGQVVAQLLARLAGDLADPVDQLGQRAELPDPLGRRLLADAGDAGQVVARVAAQRGEVGVLGRGQAVLLGHFLRREPRHVADADPGHQHGHLVGDELQRVPVARDDEDVHVPGGLGGQGGDHVVGLVPGHRQLGDAQRVQDLGDQAELAPEVGRRLLAVGLVLDELLVPEGGLAAVEGHGHVRGPLVGDHLDEHRGEAVDGVGRLPGRGREVLGGKREEGPVGQRVPVQQQQPPPGGGLLGLLIGLGLLRCLWPS